MNVVAGDSWDCILRRSCGPRAVSGSSGPRSLQSYLSLRWEAPENDGGAEVTRYEYRYRAGGASLPTTWISTGTDTKVTVEGLTNGLANSFEVQAANDAGTVSAVSVGAAAITGFTLIDADTDTELMALFGGEAVSLPDGATRRLAIRANASRGPKSVVLKLSGRQSAQRTDNSEPYTLFGDAHRRCGGEKLMEGDYTLSATAYSGKSDSGTVLDSLTVYFLRTNSDPDAPSAPRNPKAHRNDSELTLYWDVPDDNGGAFITGYQRRQRR